MFHLRSFSQLFILNIVLSSLCLGGNLDGLTAAIRDQDWEKTKEELTLHGEHALYAKLAGDESILTFSARVSTPRILRLIDQALHPDWGVKDLEALLRSSALV